MKKVLSHTAVEMIGGVAAVYPMAAGGIKQHIHLLSGFNKFIHQPEAVLGVDIIIAGSMNQEEFTLELINVG